MSEHHRTSEWSRVVRVMRPIIAKSLPQPCVDCGRAVMPDQKWQVGHIVSVAVARASGWSTQQINDPSNLGPTHTKQRGQRACNQIAGGRIGAQMTNAKRKTERRMPQW